MPAKQLVPLALCPPVENAISCAFKWMNVSTCARTSTTSCQRQSLFGAQTWNYKDSRAHVQSASTCQWFSGGSDRTSLLYSPMQACGRGYVRDSTLFRPDRSNSHQGASAPALRQELSPGRPGFGDRRLTLHSRPY